MMRMTAGLRIGVAGALAVFVAVCGQAQDLKTLKGIYAKNTEEIRQNFTFDFDALQLQYGKMLETLKGDFQSQGELKKTKAALAEIDRFKKQKSLPPDDSEIPEIKALQVSYVKRFSQLEQEMVRRLGARTVQYEQDLVSLLKALTKAGKLDEATAVEAEQAEAQREIKGYADQLAALKAGATNATGAAARMSLLSVAKPGAKNGLYLMVDLSGGPEAKKYPVSYLADVPKGGWTDEYKTDKLVLRRIEPGTFMMGSPEDEFGRHDNETQHKVTLTQAFFIGVFEVTQKQWERVMGNWPSKLNNPNCRDERPVERVTYDDIRGTGAGAGWPVTNSVDATSFLGILQAKTGQAFDLPTEAQWEYACRAGTVTALNSGKSLMSKKEDPNVAEAGRYLFNCAGGVRPDSDTSRGTAKVGSYPPNMWGLYDMHGNVWEWCLDWRGNYAGTESDPRGAITGTTRMRRGGSWGNYAVLCRSSNRIDYLKEDRIDLFGFRLALPLP